MLARADEETSIASPMTGGPSKSSCASGFGVLCRFGSFGTDSNLLDVFLNRWMGIAYRLIAFDEGH